MSKSPIASKKPIDLKGHLLIAMPGMQDVRFARSVILICSHSKEGSMGFVLNHPVASPSLQEILEELGLNDEEEEAEADTGSNNVQVFQGGPVEQGRGFVVHTLDYSTPASSRIGDLGCVTATLDALRTLTGPNPPEHSIMLLGYAGWAEGQLEEEIVQNGWLTMPATRQIVFESHHSMQYSAALAAMGISEELLSSDAGHA